MNVADDRNAVSKLHSLQIMRRNNWNNFSNLHTDIAKISEVTKFNSQ